jgi:hypothetical protein
MVSLLLTQGVAKNTMNHISFLFEATMLAIIHHSLCQMIQTCFDWIFGSFLRKLKAASASTAKSSVVDSGYHTQLDHSTHLLS